LEAGRQLTGDAPIQLAIRALASGPEDD